MKNIFISLITLFSFFCYSQANFEGTGLAPNFFGYDLDGNYQEMEDYLNEGKIVILEFMNVNCGACQAYAPYVEELYEEYGPNGSDQIEIIAIETNPSTDNYDCQNYINDFDANYHLINGQFSSFYNSQINN